MKLSLPTNIKLAYHLLIGSATKNLIQDSNEFSCTKLF